MAIATIKRHEFKPIKDGEICEMEMVSLARDGRIAGRMLVDRVCGPANDCDVRIVASRVESRLPKTGLIHNDRPPHERKGVTECLSAAPARPAARAAVTTARTFWRIMAATARDQRRCWLGLRVQGVMNR